jgi:hypothetical protein
MPDPTLSQMLAAAAAMLLKPPEAAVLAALAASDGDKVDLAQARQDFYDVLCVPQSGRYISPYAHVLAHGHLWNDNCWNFPPPRFDGGDALASWYEAVGFDPMGLDVDPMLRGPHRSLDQVGFILAYLAGLVASQETAKADGPAADGVIDTFLAEHLGGAWLDRFCTLLSGCGSPYLQAVAGAVDEVVEMTRSRYQIDVPASVSRVSQDACAINPRSNVTQA